MVPQPALTGALALNGVWLALFEGDQTERERQRAEGIQAVLGGAEECMRGW